MEKAERKRKAVVVVGLAMLAFGSGFLGACLAVDASFASLQKPEHMTDDSIAVRDMDDATYTFDMAYLESRENQSWVVYAFALVILSCGWLIMKAMPSGADIHHAYCKGEVEARYCSGCGIELKDLEEG